jgi:repressor LexA
LADHLNNLTFKQKKVYLAIESYIKKRGISPTVREIGEMVGDKTPGAVQGILSRLEKKGVITRKVGIARSIQLVSSNAELYPKPVYIPEIKKITHRNVDDLLNIYNIVTYHPLPPTLAKQESGMLIYQCSHSGLEPSGIKSGDFLLLNVKADIKSGDIILVFYNNLALLRFYHADNKTGKILLKADSNILGKELFDPDEVKIVGKVEGRYTKFL